MPPRLLMTGSRTWTDVPLLEGELHRAWVDLGSDPRTVLVHGACPAGADRMAAKYWAHQGRPVEPHPAQWPLWGKRAGLIRNAYMVSLGADLCIAFIRGNSRGATHCYQSAVAADMPHRLIWGAQ